MAKRKIVKKTKNKNAVKKSVNSAVKNSSFKDKFISFIYSSRFKRVVNISKNLVFVVVVALAALSILTVLPLRIPIKPFVVLSGSMRPTIYEGAIVFVDRSVKELKKDDVITFIKPDNFQDNVTHRIVEVTSSGFKTKGDANNTADNWIVKPEAVWGKVAFSVPLIGFLVNFAKTKLGVIFLVVIPLIFISLDEVRIIRREFLKIRASRLAKRVEKTAKSSLKTISLILMLLLPLMSFRVGTTQAAFTDQISVSGNIVTTGTWGSAIIVINELMPDPSTAPDGNMPNGQWVELKNIGNSSANLAGFTLTDGRNHVLTISTSNSDNNNNTADAGETTIAPGGYLVVYRNGANFQFKQNNSDSVTLKEPNNVLIDSAAYTGNPPADQSYSRIPDGTGSFVFTSNVTKGAANSLSAFMVLQSSLSMSSEISFISEEMDLQSTPTPTPSPTSEPVVINSESLPSNEQSSEPSNPSNEVTPTPEPLVLPEVISCGGEVEGELCAEESAEPSSTPEPTLGPTPEIIVLPEPTIEAQSTPAPESNEAI